MAIIKTRDMIEQRNRLLWRYELEQIRRELQPGRSRSKCTWDGWCLAVWPSDGIPKVIEPSNSEVGPSLFEILDEKDYLVEIEVHVGPEEVE